MAYNKFAIDDISPDVPPEETTTEAGQEKGMAKETEEVKNEETPEETGQVSKEPLEEETPEENGEEEKEAPKSEGKKYSEQFTTLSAALKAAENLAVVLADDVDFKEMTLDQVKDWYDKNRPRVGKEGFKGNREKARQLNKDIKAEEDRLTRIEKKFDAFIEKQTQPARLPDKPKELTPPAKPVFDYEAYSDLLQEDVRAANKMLEDYHKAQDIYLDERVKYEGAILGKGLKDKFDEINQFKEKLTKREAEEAAQKAQEEESRQITKRWGDAEKKVREFVETQGDNDFKEYEKAMSELIKSNHAVYIAIAGAEGEARALFQLYQDAKRESSESEKDKRMAELEEELAALKKGKTLDEINAAKGAARITQANGGVTKKIPQKPLTPQEIFEAQMIGNSRTRNKYEIDY